MENKIESLEDRVQDARWLLHVALDVLSKLDHYKDQDKAKSSAVRAIEKAMSMLKEQK